MIWRKLLTEIIENLNDPGDEGGPGPSLDSLVQVRVVTRDKHGCVTRSVVVPMGNFYPFSMCIGVEQSTIDKATPEEI